MTNYESYGIFNGQGLFTTATCYISTPSTIVSDKLANVKATFDKAKGKAQKLKQEIYDWLNNSKEKHVSAMRHKTLKEEINDWLAI